MLKIFLEVKNHINLRGLQNTLLNGPVVFANGQTCLITTKPQSLHILKCRAVFTVQKF